MNITIFVPLSRRDRIQTVAEQIAALDKRVQDTFNILVIIDHQKISESDVLKHFGRLCNKVTVVYSGLKPVPEMDLRRRRERITEVFRMAQARIPFSTDLVLTIEDDGDFNPSAMTTLLEDYDLLSQVSNVGLVSGVEAGRWAVKMVGVWNCDNPRNPSRIWSYPYKNNNVEIHEIKAAGFYFFVTSAELFRNTPLTFGDFGPDVFFGLSLSASGYVNYVDWNVQIDHVTPHGIIRPKDGIHSAKFEKLGESWRMLV